MNETKTFGVPAPRAPSRDLLETAYRDKLDMMAEEIRRLKDEISLLQEKEKPLVAELKAFLLEAGGEVGGDRVVARLTAAGKASRVIDVKRLEELAQKDEVLAAYVEACKVEKPGADPKLLVDWRKGVLVPRPISLAPSSRKV